MGIILQSLSSHREFRIANAPASSLITEPYPGTVDFFDTTASPARTTYTLVQRPIWDGLWIAVRLGVETARCKTAPQVAASSGDSFASRGLCWLDESSSSPPQSR